MGPNPLSDRPANVTNITLTGAMDDVHGRTLAVHQDHDGVRIDVAGVEIMLTHAGVEMLQELISQARYDAAVWAIENPDA